MGRDQIIEWSNPARGLPDKKWELHPRTRATSKNTIRSFRPIYDTWSKASLTDTRESRDPPKGLVGSGPFYERRGELKKQEHTGNTGIK